MPNKRNAIVLASIVLFIVFMGTPGCKKDTSSPENIEIVSCFLGNLQLQYGAEFMDAPLNKDIRINFSVAIDSISAIQAITLNDDNGSLVGGIKYAFEDSHKSVIMKFSQNLAKLQHYSLKITNKLKGIKGEKFGGAEYAFKTASGIFLLNKITIEGLNFNTGSNPINIKRSGFKIHLEFSEPVDTTLMGTKFNVAGNKAFEIIPDPTYKTLDLTYQDELGGYKKYYFNISSALGSASGNNFAGFSNWFISAVDSTLKFPLITDDELLTLVQSQTFRYFYDFAHPVSGLARERNTSGDIVTTGGSGFGVMALIVGMERGFITRSEGITRLDKMVSFLENCDRFHGAWPHWLNGSTGSVVPFSAKDNGGDLVETAFMAQGLLTMRQYLNPSSPVENDLINRITSLYNSIEWDWYTRGGQNVLYWHWSPNYGWDMNFKIQGYNETLITYILAASSGTHTISKPVYQSGYARNGAILNGKSFYGYTLPVGYDYGGPLFFAHYSFLGLDPRNLSDVYADYWTQNVNHSLINWAYCTDNPKNYPNYSNYCWGLTASDIPGGYGVSEPTNDRGVITPTAAISSLPYTPEQSMNAIRFFYFILGDQLWGDYGFYDAFDIHAGWWADSYLAIDQGPEIVMIENYRTGLLWNLFMSCPEVQSGLTKLGFNY